MVLKEQTVLITGAGGGIGRYLAKALVPKVKAVVGIDVDDSNFKELEAGGVQCRQCDLTDNEATAATVDALYGEHDITVLINNAGWIYSAPLVNFLSRDDRRHSFEQWNRCVQLNLYTVFNTSAAVVDKMVDRRLSGLVVNISSISGKGNMGQTAYSAAKAGIDALTITWGKELGMVGIRTAGIAPGFFETEATYSALNERTIKKLKKEIPLGRLGSLDELETAIRFVIEDGYFNGKVLELDGGLPI